MKSESGNFFTEKPASAEQIKEISIPEKTLVFLVGLPASGKSTFARRHFPLDSIVSSDAIRGELSNNQRNQLVTPNAFEIAKKIATERLKRGGVAVIDAQNLHEGTRASFYQAAEEAGARVIAIFLDVSAEESAARDAKRGHKQVGQGYIKQRSGLQKVAGKMLERSPKINEIHTVKADDFDKVRVVLPKAEQKAFEADREFLRAAEESSAVIAAVENGLLEMDPNACETIEVKTGTVVYIEKDKKSQAEQMAKNNFLPDQIIDCDRLAKRLNAEPGDEIVEELARMILIKRIKLNLTTAVLTSEEFPFKDKISSAMRDYAERKNFKLDDVSISADAAKADARIEVYSDAPDAPPLFFVGDTHGCYKTMRELTGNVRRKRWENANNENSPDRERKIIFIGDMADRGPYDAETVIYICALVRSGQAVLVKGNHDENLLKGLKGLEVKPSESRRTIAELRRRLKPSSIKKIIEVLENAPICLEWKKLVAVHASLPKIPRKDEQKDDWREHTITHGAKSGEFTGARQETWKLLNTTAKDPGVWAIGGHTHEDEVMIDEKTETAVLDVSAEIKGKLYGMYYPEMQIACAEEPSVLKMYKILTGSELPKKDELLAFLAFVEQEHWIETKPGQGEFEGLTLLTYSKITEYENLWEKYPVLRHFRGMIIDKEGNIVARPFKKTHKAGVEIPLDKLEIKPEKVFEKANGSMGIVYHWNDKWQVATKFSFANEGYTKPAAEMLSQMNTGALDPAKTYLFEIILPNDSHIVDYKGKRELVLLNATDTVGGENISWQEAAETAKQLGCRAAEDMTDQFKGMTVADIYKKAQKPGAFSNLEGLMALYRSPDGELTTAKIKTREYDDKKFVRDRLDWEKIIKYFDAETMDLPHSAREEILTYNFDNEFANAALETRIGWIKEQFAVVVSQAKEFLSLPHQTAQALYDKRMASGATIKEAKEAAMRAAAPILKKILEEHSTAYGKGMGAFMGFLRGLISGEEKSERVLVKYALKRVSELVEEETKKRGKAAFWIIPKE